MKAPPKKEGKMSTESVDVVTGEASMKALPKRKGKCLCCAESQSVVSLNESPSEKEGKSKPRLCASLLWPTASMKALPKRKGNVTV